MSGISEFSGIFWWISGSLVSFWYFLCVWTPIFGDFGFFEVFGVGIIQNFSVFCGV